MSEYNRTLSTTGGEGKENSESNIKCMNLWKIFKWIPFSKKNKSATQGSNESKGKSISGAGKNIKEYGDDGTHECPICYDSFPKASMAESDDPRCTHKVCWKCYGMAHKVGQPINKCPLCRADFTKHQSGAGNNMEINPGPAVLEFEEEQEEQQERYMRPIDYMDSCGNIRNEEFMRCSPEERNIILEELIKISEMAETLEETGGVDEENGRLMDSRLVLRSNLEITPIEMHYILLARNRNQTQ